MKSASRDGGEVVKFKLPLVERTLSKPIMNHLYSILNLILDWCYGLLGNYVLAIVLFTFITKLVLFPVTIWVQKNSVKYVGLLPEINRIRIKYFGDKDTIGEKEQELYKENGYNAFASVIPALIQIFLLIGIIGAIHQKVNSGDPGLINGLLDLGAVPVETGGMYLMLPLLAGISAFLLSWSQNHANVLQSESGKGMKYGTAAVSVGISLFLGFYVQTAVVIYWIASNLFSMIQQYIVNAMIPPEKNVDFEELEKTRQELSSLENLDSGKGKRRDRSLIKREKQDYKKFFSVVNKHLVFYSESGGFYKYFKGIIEYILQNTNIVIHYITSDPDDKIFLKAKENPQIRPYYIGQTRLITLMMKMDADMVVMTTPDLDNYQIKRSYVRKDIEYVYVQHHMGSINMILRKGAVDHFDTVFIAGDHHEEEIRRTEKEYGLPAKKLVRYGFPLLDEMIDLYSERMASKIGQSEKKMVLVAPSWHDDGIMNTCVEEILDILKKTPYHVIVRPHPQYVRHHHERLEQLALKYEAVEFELDFSSNTTVLDADCLLTDWSSIAFEYAFATGRPVLFVDTPMKVNNPEYKKIDVEPFDIWIRNKVGVSLNLENIKQIRAAVDDLLVAGNDYRKTIFAFRDEHIYNVGCSSEVGARYIIESLQTKVSERRRMSE